MNVSELAECPACGELAEPEQDGDLLYSACACGMEFGFRQEVQQDSSCQLGIDESVRRAVSQQLASGQPVLQIGRRSE